MIKQSFEEATEQSTTVTPLKSAGHRSSTTLRNGHLKIGYQLWQKEEERRTDVNIAWIQLFHSIPVPSSNSRTFRRPNAVDPALQDNVLLPKRFTEYICHVGNANELNSKTRNGVIPGRKRLKKRKTSSILHYSEHDGRRFWHGWNSMRSYETKDRAIHEYSETLSKIQYVGAIWSSLKRKGLQFYQTRSHAVVLYNTLFAACIEKVVCMKTQEELYQKVRLTQRVPRVVPKSNSQYGQQDLRSQDARSSWEPSSDSKSYRRNL